MLRAKFQRLSLRRSEREYITCLRVRCRKRKASERDFRGIPSNNLRPAISTCWSLSPTALRLVSCQMPLRRISYTVNNSSPRPRLSNGLPERCLPPSHSTISSTLLCHPGRAHRAPPDGAERLTVPTKCGIRNVSMPPASTTDIISSCQSHRICERSVPLRYESHRGLHCAFCGPGYVRSHSRTVIGCGLIRIGQASLNGITFSKSSYPAPLRWPLPVQRAGVCPKRRG